jgi:hypothetical protein
LEAANFPRSSDGSEQIGDEGAELEPAASDGGFDEGGSEDAATQDGKVICGAIHAAGSGEG